VVGDGATIADGAAVEGPEPVPTAGSVS
jgi:hypothetical protein